MFSGNVTKYLTISVTIKNTTGAKGKTKTVNTSKLTYTLKKLKKNKAYYIKARAYKLDSTGAKVYGPWSKVKKIRITK